jgi:lipopolysaccharide cholinephosphotransferase
VTGEPEPAALALRALQHEEIELLVELARRCEAASLRWYVLGGTLIGAARHGGFVPWDDDVDVGLPRPDYERFAALAARPAGAEGEAGDAGTGAEGAEGAEVEAGAGARFAWQSAATEAAYPFAYGKLLLAGSAVVDPSTAHLPLRRGAFIDVFPLDGAPGPGLERALHRVGLKLAVSSLGSRLRRPGVRGVAALTLRLVPRSLALGVLAAFARRHPFDGSAFVVNPAGAYGYARECQPRDRFEPAARLRFEGLDVPAPGRWRAYLEQVYGEWERLPPPAERLPRHGLIAGEVAR